MALSSQSLDDRAYADLLEESRALIAGYAPEWTDHNASDPGITLVELFAWLAEMLVYRTDQITDRQIAAFARLIRGPRWSWTPPADPEARARTIAEEMRAAVVELRAPFRAVTAADLAERASEVQGVARAHCVPRRHLAASTETDRPGHVSVLVVPGDPALDAEQFEDLRRRVVAHLDQRRVITTQIHVLRPVLATIDVDAIVARRADVPDEQLRGALTSALQGLLETARWPFGRDVLASEMTSALEARAEVDFVAQLGLFSPQAAAAKPVWHESGDLVGLQLGPYALPQAGDVNLWTAPAFVRMDIRAQVRAAPRAPHAEVRRAVKAAIGLALHPAHGGPTGDEQWGPIPVSALADAIEALPSVQSLAALAVSASPRERVAPNAVGKPQMTVLEGELVEVDATVAVS